LPQCSMLRERAARFARGKARYRTSLAAILSIACAQLPAAPGTAAAHVVDGDASAVIKTTEGPIQGLVSNDVTAFLGIPYAAPPVGPLRWMPPKAHGRWTTILQAKAFAPICAQTTTLGVFSGPRNANEDCLYLNVFTPAHKLGAALPVIVYIHGGGNYDGETTGYDGSKLAAKGHVVVVTMEYRLNLMGFLAHPALDGEGHHFGNYGILDQQAALRWVGRNIAMFGGDSKNVTLSGQSAGAIDTMISLLSPLATGLFQRAICQSACPATYPIASRAKAEDVGVAFAVAAGCGSGNAPDVARCLRSLPAAEIEELAGTASTPSKFITASGIVDGEILPDQPLTLFKSGRFNQVPLMNGFTKDEVNFILAATEYWTGPDNTRRTPPTADQYMKYLDTTYAPPAYSVGTAAKVQTLYPVTATATPPIAWNRAATDSRICNVRNLGKVVGRFVPVYAYEFADTTAPSYFPAMPGLDMQAYHTADIQYLFPLWHGGPDGIPHSLNSDQEMLSDQIIAAWANFARSGNPNGSGNSPWPLYSADANAAAWSIQDGRAPSSMADRPFSALHHCDFWDSIEPKS
jgi:para-nitrobenzyl esterase